MGSKCQSTVIFDVAYECLSEFERIENWHGKELATKSSEMNNLAGHSSSDKSRQNIGRYDFMGLRNSFTLWSDYTGALSLMESSLDARLQGFPDISSMFVELLEMISRNLRRLIYERKTSTSDDSIATWADSLQAIDYALDRLHYLGAAIRKASVKQLQYNVTSYLAEEDALFRGFAAKLVKRDFPQAHPSLHKHLGDTIAVRRKIMRRKLHHARKLAARRSHQPPEPSKQNVQIETHIQVSQPQATQAQMSNTPVPAHITQAFVGPQSVETKASKPNPEASIFKQVLLPNRPLLQSTVGSSQSVDHDSLSYPECPLAESGETHVQCPYCLMPLPVTMMSNRKRELHWRSHLREDLQPYVCLFPECAGALTFFTHKKEWISHMEASHSQDWPRRVYNITWYCDIEHDEVQQFQSEIEWRDHMKNPHAHPRRRPKPPTDIQLEALSTRKQQCVLRAQFVCPFCECIPEKIQVLMGREDERDLTKLLHDHIATHMVALSLISLPTVDEGVAGAEGSLIASGEPGSEAISSSESNMTNQPHAGIDNDEESSLDSGSADLNDSKPITENLNELTSREINEAASRLQPRSRKPREYKPYRYDPLPRSHGAIRILNLFPGDNADDDIICDLIMVRGGRNDQIPYDALSWCRDTSDKSHRIGIRREGMTYAKYVNSNLFAALKNLRLPNKYRYLWADMICIDQENVNEKNYQVAMMHKIFGDANRVCIWLGPADESSRVAIQFIKSEVLDLQNFDRLQGSPDTSKKWSAVLDLMTRSWFSRRWAVQDIALARKAVMYCGHDNISWEKFAVAVQLFAEVETATHRLSEIMIRDRFPTHSQTLLENISALDASLLVEITGRIFRNDSTERTTSLEPASDTDSDMERKGPSSASNGKGQSFEHTIPSTKEKIPANVLRSRRQPLLNLEELVSSLTVFDTAVPHDTIYSLLAIAKDVTPRAAPSLPRQDFDIFQDFVQKQIFVVDYNTPYVDVCKDFIQFSIKRSLQTGRTRALDVICRPWAADDRTLGLTGDGKNQIEEAREKEESVKLEREHAVLTWQRSANDEGMPLPSWVPRLSDAPHAIFYRAGLEGPRISRKNADSLVGLPHLAFGNYEAAQTKIVDMKALKFRKRIKLGYFSMYIRGFLLDRVQEVQEVARHGYIPAEWAQMAGWPTTSGRPPEAFWRTLVADRGENNRNPPAYYVRACEELFKRSVMNSPGVDTVATIHNERNSILAQFCRRVQAATWNRALIRTESGRLGLASRHVQKGDQICILYGCSVPVILRKSAKKPTDLFAVEIELELEFLVNSIFQCYRKYAMRKKRHELRKDFGMLRLCKQWFQSTNWLQHNGLTRDQLDHALLKNRIESFHGLIKLALKDFSDWRQKERQKSWETAYMVAGGTDWWAFECALSAGRRWKQVVKMRREARWEQVQPTTVSTGEQQQGPGHSRDIKWGKHGSSPDNAQGFASLLESSQRVGLSRRPNIERLTQEERAQYDAKIRKNLEERLGEEGHFSYRFLGECYIHGMMDGEAIRQQNGEGIPSVVFEIR